MMCRLKWSGWLTSRPIRQLAPINPGQESEARVSGRTRGRRKWRVVFRFNGPARTDRILVLRGIILGGHRLETLFAFD